MQPIGVHVRTSMCHQRASQLWGGSGERGECVHQSLKGAVIKLLYENKLQAGSSTSSESTAAASHTPTRDQAYSHMHWWCHCLLNVSHTCIIHWQSSTLLIAVAFSSQCFHGLGFPDDGRSIFCPVPHFWWSKLTDGQTLSERKIHRFRCVQAAKSYL